MNVPANKAALLRTAQRVVADGATRALAPVVEWQRINEAPTDFDGRLQALRLKLPQRQLLLAVQSGRRATPPLPGVRHVEMPEKHFATLHPMVWYRSRLLTGGRGSGKSFAAARSSLLLAVTTRLRILCAREFQNSIRESVHHLLSDQIDAFGLGPYFDVTERSITCKLNGSEFIFEGLHANISRIKSLEALDIVWIEQAETISARSMEVLIPTLRKKGSWFLLTANPDDPHAPIESYRDREDCLHVHTTFEDNPWFPDVLRAEMEYLRRVDDDAYRHVWLGECRTASDAQVLKGKYEIAEFAADAAWSGPYYGADWGFAQDPTTLVRCWIDEASRTLYVDYEAWGIAVDIDRTPALFDAVPDARRHTVRADSARPETISFMQRNGYPNVAAVTKWPGSVEDGIAHLRQYAQIVLHPRCVHVAEEMRLYSYKVDRLSGDVLPDLKPGNDHTIDALRYALNPMIKRSGPEALLEFYAQDAPKRDLPAMAASRVGATVTEL